MPTMRSLFSFEQFEEAMQKLAHKIALDAVKSLKDVRIDIRRSRFYIVETDEVSIRFHPHHITYGEGRWGGSFYFDVEEKVYLTSNHSTKISFYAPEGEEKETAEKVTAFIDRIMSEVKPVPRFNLSEHLKKA
jgi:hypothetical protein